MATGALIRLNLLQMRTYLMPVDSPDHGDERVAGALSRALGLNDLVNRVILKPLDLGAPSPRRSRGSKRLLSRRILNGDKRCLDEYQSPVI